MEKYRIIESESCGIKSYKIQKKSIFGFWYNPDNIDAYVTGWHDTHKEAMEIITRKLATATEKIVYETQG